MANPERPPIIPEYAQPDTDGDAVVTLVTLPPTEAELACAKLRSEGIDAFAANINIATVHPLLNIPVRVQVRREDLEAARAILERPPENAADDEYVDEPWRCPTCRRKTLDLLPLTPGQRLRRDAWIALMVIGFVSSLIPLYDLLGLPASWRARLAAAWLAACAVLGLWVLLVRRVKRCRECGWTSTT